ncbi:MAG TPA: hypothetical protein EYP65_08515, partial [Armatimonadetes bacterium]|nr:hypothetical protein [Armatimonadota bacterium]
MGFLCPLAQLSFFPQIAVVACFAEGRKVGVGLTLPIEAGRLRLFGVDKMKGEIRAKGEADGIPFILSARKLEGGRESVLLEAKLFPRKPASIRLKWKEFLLISRDGELTKPRLDIFWRSKWPVQPSLYASSPQTGSFLWLLDLTHLDKTVRVTTLWPVGGVVLHPPEFGWLKVPGEIALPKGSWVLSRALVFFTPEPEGKIEEARFFLDAVSEALEILELPRPRLPNWKRVAKDEIFLLSHDKRAWVEWNGGRFFRAYFACRPYEPELITQVDIARGLWRFYNRYGEGSELVKRLGDLIRRFFHPRFGSFHNNLATSRRIDSWYFMSQLANLARLYSEGFPIDKSMLLSSLQRAIRFGRAVNYQFPVFADPLTLKPIFGFEPDVAGCYVWLMMEAYRLFGDRKYLEEALRAASVIPNFGFSLAYELHMTAASCAGLLRLYKATGERRWAEAALVPLANLVANLWLWESDFGPAALYPTTFGLSAMPGIGYTAMKESWEAWDYMREALMLAEGVWPRSALDMARLFVEHQPSTMWASIASETPPFGLWGSPKMRG